jgi:hypothetical protein
MSNDFKIAYGDIHIDEKDRQLICLNLLIELIGKMGLEHRG